MGILFERVMLQYPVWFDAYSGDRTDLLTALVGLEARRRSHEIKREPYLALGMRLWKRPFVRQFLGDVRFVDEVSGAGQRQVVAWGSSVETDEADLRMEDGFLRSVGLGAELATPLSFCLAVVAAGLSKYNVGGTEVDVPDGRRVILVPGQVEDDASILLGAGDISTNLFCDQVLSGVSAQAALKVADEVCTMTSLMGFEALLRGKKITCFGRPFYAGWGLTQDRGVAMPRRRNGVSLDGLVHASLIDYPIYRDPVSGLACPVEVIVERLAHGQVPVRHANRALSKLQGLFANQSWLWR